MKKILKSIYFSGIKFIHTITSLICILLFNRWGVNRRICKLNEKRTKAVSIISGGPSAKDVIDERKYLLEGTDLVVLNNFGNTADFFIFKPRYYVLLDPAYFDANFFNEGLHEKETTNSRTQEMLLIENLKKVDWEMILFVPTYSHGRILGEEIENNRIKVVLYHGTRVEGFDWFQNWMYRHNQGLPSSRNVIIPAIELMINIGYRYLYLYGCEFSWTKTMDIDTENGQMFFNDRHFYSKEEIRYFGKGAYRWWLEAIAEMLKATDILACYADKMSVKVVNRSKGSFIDSFEYENMDNIPQR